MPRENAIYLDFNAGAPLHPRVIEALLSYFRIPLSENSAVSVLANPSSIHFHGRQAKRAVAEAREFIARSIGLKTDPEQLLFTSSGSEANQMVIRSILESEIHAGRKVHWITSPVEHDSVMQMVSWVKNKGGEVSFLDLDSAGRPQAESLERLIRPETRLVSVIWVNNETGAVTPLEDFSTIIKKHSIKLHVDCAQAWGKLPIDTLALGADAITLSSHKIGAPAGTGVVWIAPGTRLTPLIAGKQEKGRRGGTENVLGIIATGAAAQAIDPLAWDYALRPIRDQFESGIKTQISGTYINGESAKRIANTTNLSFDGVTGEGLIMALDLAGFSVSSGSACSSGVLEPSHVLLAMGRTKAQATAAVRVSFGLGTSSSILERFTDALDQTIIRMRNVKTLA